MIDYLLYPDLFFILWEKKVSVYNLDFDTMRQIMQAHKQTGDLSADTPSGVARLRGPCRIEITVKDGDIIACSISNARGDRFIGQDALQHLSRLGRLRWTFEAKPGAATRLPLPAHSREQAKVFLIPRRVASSGGQLQMRSWPRLHKLVFAMADGSANVAQIAATLSVAPDAVIQALRDLQSIGAIELERQQP